MAMVSAHPLNTVSYYSYQTPIQTALRSSSGLVYVPGHIFKVVQIPVLYQITYSNVSQTSPIPLSPLSPPKPSPPVQSPSTPAPALEPEPEPEPNPQVPSPAEPTLPAPTPAPIDLIRIPVSTRRPGTPHHRQANPEEEQEEEQFDIDIRNETLKPPSTEASSSDKKNPNHGAQQVTNSPTPPSLIHHS